MIDFAAIQQSDTYWTGVYSLKEDPDYMIFDFDLWDKDTDRLIGSPADYVLVAAVLATRDELEGKSPEALMIDGDYMVRALRY